MVSRGCCVRVVVGVVFWWAVARSHTFVLAWLLGLCQPTAKWAGWGRCLTTHPQLRVWVVKHLRMVVVVGWLAGEWWLLLGCGTGKRVVGWWW